MLSVLQAELSKPQTERLEWMYYFPATSIILNPNVPLELFLPPTQNSTFEERHILYSEPVNTASPTPDLSNTVFAAKVHQWSIDLFTTLVARTQSHSKQSNHHPNAITLHTLLTLPAPLSPKAHALGLPPHWLNAWPSTVPTTAAPSAPTHIYTDPTDPEDSDTDSDTELPHQVRRGSFVLDLPLPPRNKTVSNDDHGDSGSESRWQDSPPSPSDEDEDVDDETSVVLAQRFEHWLARAEARMPLWEAPLQETWYASEAREFWAGGQKDGSTTTTTAPVTTTPVAGGQAGGHQGLGTPSSATAALGQQVAQLKEEALTLASSRFHRHTTHARHAILSAAQLTLSNATAAITTVHTSIPASVSADAAGTQQLKARIEAAVQTTLHLKSLLERKDCATDDVKMAVADVEEAVRKVETQIKQAAAQEKRRAKEIERLRQEEEKLAGMEAVEIERQQKQEEAESKMSLAGLPKPW
ncbi:putative galactosyl transferase gma12 mnn10 family protein [Neofusicoccum parvum UCRNP2]|uniref:Putative galactosyl transferase gma12 mnn10 family protein n=1 Tax=Botryosphaeria parva (strain UCR-NP2) TaxID=1287680 RepID=R1E5U3_BOTPV|nr:putative galactosyl transferase gma12 mnn10 family protein [Neofusicoccum parvum UCRNP2]